MISENSEKTIYTFPIDTTVDKTQISRSYSPIATRIYITKASYNGYSKVLLNDKRN